MKDPRRWMIGLIALCCALVWSAQWYLSPTYDEPQHLHMGLRILRDWDFSRFDNSKMPVSVFNAIGWHLSEIGDGEGSWFLARLPQAGWLLGSAWIVFRWTGRFYGPWAALGAASLVALDPNLVAHAGLVTTDAPCTFFLLAACFTWARALEDTTHRNHALAGAVLGLAQAAKFTAVFLVPIHVVIAAGWCALSRSLAPMRRAPTAILTALLALNLAYGFQGFGTAGEDIQWRSHTFSSLSESSLPLPVPRPWIEGLDWVKSDDDAGHGNIWLAGELTPMGQKAYYAKALAWKLPLPLLLLSLIALFRRPEGRTTLAWVVPPAFLLGWFSLAFNFQLGLRYLLPAVPFLAVLTARLPPRWLAAGATWTLLSGLSWWPWYLSYQNETLLDRTEAWRRLADSNLDWGQGQQVAEDWLKEHPDGLVDPEVPAPGPVLLTANLLTGVLGDPIRHACLRDHLPPTEHLAYAQYPMNLSAADFEACFPRVEVEGTPEGGLPAGAHLVVLKYRGEATLTIGEWSDSGSSNGEALIGAVVYAKQPFDAAIDFNGPEAKFYLDGKPIPAETRR